MPCSICYELNRVTEPEERPLQHNIQLDLNWHDFLSSAKACYICDIVVKGCRGCFQQHNIDESDILSCSLFFYYGGQSELHDDDWHNDKDIRFVLKGPRKRFDVSMFAWDTTGIGLGPELDYEDIPNSWGWIPSFCRTSPRTDSDEAFQVVKKWIDECVHENHVHDFCDRQLEAELPKRIVYVGTDDSQIRLIEPRDSQVARYISLSHCWGKVQIITTTKATLQDRLAGIPFHQLSKTFQHAIHVTRRLGIQYIWIDSLCIVQDDLHDWKVESAKMMDIYSNAFLTIAATHSRDGNGGLFSSTPDFQVSGTTPSTSPDGPEPYRLFFRETIDHHLEYIEDNEYNNITTGGYPTITHHPLLTRAWVYQERMLSTRVLHFGHHELAFECRSTARCECNGIRYHGSSTCAVPLTKISLADALDSFFVDPAVAATVDWSVYAAYYLARMWWTLVSSYTALRLTQAGDKLPALGGLAKLMAGKRLAGGVGYLAGLWGDTLVDDLCWFGHGMSGTLKGRARAARGEWGRGRVAPSWSWASVQTPVFYLDTIVAVEMEEDPVVDRGPFEHFVRVEGARVESSAVDEFGEVGEGWVRLGGRVAVGRLEREEAADGSVRHYVLFSKGQRYLMKADYLLDEAGDDQVLPGSEVHCLRMSYTELPITAHIFSLVLRPVSQETGVYERIGCIDVLMKLDPPPEDPMMDDVFGGVKDGTVIIV